MNKPIYLLSTALLALAGATSCSDNVELPSDASSSGMQLKLRGFSATGQDALHIYQFDADRLVEHSALRQYDAAAISLTKGATRNLYCVSGIEMRDASDISAAEFARSIVTLGEDAAFAPMFFSGSAEIGEEQNGCEMTMRRGVARIDLDACDAEMEISEILVEDVPTASYVFPGCDSDIDAPTTTAAHSFASAPDGLEEGLFTIFESAQGLHVIVKGTARGEAVEIPAELPAVERGKVYTLRIYDRNVSLSASFGVSDWEEGTTISGGPDTAHALLIDEALSSIPQGVKVDYMRNLIEVPAEGVSNMVLAFNADLRVDLDTVLLTGERVEKDSVRQKYLKIAKDGPEATPTGILTKFNISIDEQLKARPGYEIRLELRKPNLAVSCDYVTIRVAESPYQIQTVRLAGVNWMAFNATTPDLAEQIFPLPGKTVEETYQEAWIASFGLFFQYGRQLAHDPWNRSDPNANTTEMNLPWTSPEAMPVPEGYHVATAKEWNALLPSGTQIPSTYAAGNGEKVKVEIVEYGPIDDSPCAAANRSNLRKRCIRFESMETGNVLIFPVCAMKAATKDQYPGNGKPLHQFGMYWFAEDRGVMLFTIAGSDGDFTCTPKADKWNYNGFVPTRGVKND